MFTLEHSGSGTLLYATQDSAGFDICANESKNIPPGEWLAIKTGLRIVGVQYPEFGQIRLIPELQIRPRSGLALRKGVTVLNSPSTIDADYRGEILVILINHSKESFLIQPGDRIAQALCTLCVQISGIMVQSTVRGENGFGSSGV